MSTRYLHGLFAVGHLQARKGMLRRPWSSPRTRRTERQSLTTRNSRGIRSGTASPFPIPPALPGIILHRTVRVKKSPKNVKLLQGITAWRLAADPSQSLRQAAPARPSGFLVFNGTPAGAGEFTAGRAFHGFPSGGFFIVRNLSNPVGPACELAVVSKPLPQPPPLRGEGEKKRRRSACSPSPFRGGGWGRGFVRDSNPQAGTPTALARHPAVRYSPSRIRWPHDS